MSTLLDSEILDSPLLTDEGDHDRFAHYARKSEVTRAYVEGVPVVALCGKKWIPSRDPSKFPMCPVCLEIYNEKLID